ncbi:hypothetical protein O9993_15265 [Vibrio lentus]|nr:hypothetical protein [Vibrio lentus]
MIKRLPSLQGSGLAMRHVLDASKRTVKRKSDGRCSFQIEKINTEALLPEKISRLRAKRFTSKIPRSDQPHPILLKPAEGLQPVDKEAIWMNGITCWCR